MSRGRGRAGADPAKRRAAGASATAAAPVLVIETSDAFDPRPTLVELREGVPPEYDPLSGGVETHTYPVRLGGVDHVLHAVDALHRAIASTGTGAGGRVAILGTGSGSTTRWAAWRVGASGRAIGKDETEKGVPLIGEEGDGRVLTSVCERCKHDLIRHREDIVLVYDRRRACPTGCAAPGTNCWRCGAGGWQYVAWVRATTSDGVVYRMRTSGLLLDRRLGQGW